MTTLTLQPAAAAGNDTFIDEANPTHNYGVNTGMYVQTLEAGDYRALIKFDLSSIPNGALISSATLTLRTILVASEASVDIGIYRLYPTKAFYEGDKNGAAPDADTDGSTWNYRNAYSSAPVAWGAAGAQAAVDYYSTATATTAVTANAADYTWNLKADVQHMVDGTDNNGWILIAAASAGEYKVFGTSDNGTEGNRPKLVVEYTTPNTSAITWNVMFRWDGSNYTDEAAYAQSLQIERGRDGPLDEVRAGKCTIVLDNYTDRFNPWNSGGALYTYLKPGIAMYVNARYHGIAYLLFSGHIEDIRPSGKLGNKVVTITAYDGWHIIKDQTAELSLSIASQTHDTRLEDIATAISIPAIDCTSSKSCALFWANKNAGQLIQDVMNSEFGYVWIQPSTSYVYRLMSRGSDYTGRGQTTIGDSYLTDIAINQPWDLICNKCRVTAHIPSLTAEMDVWKLEEIISIAAGATTTVWAPYVDSYGQSCTCGAVTTPTTPTDYTANTQADGLGTDKSAQIAITMTVYTETAKLAIKNNDAGTVYLTLCKLRGTAVEYKATTAQHEDSTSKSAYGTHQQNFSLDWLQSIDDANTFATDYVHFWKDPQVMPVITIQRKLPLMLRNEYECDVLDLFDKITFSSTAYGISSSTFLLGRIRYWTENGMQDLRGEFQLEPFT